MDKQTVQALMALTDTDSLKKQGYVPMEKWGKDHWSQLGYVSTCVVDGQDLNRERMSNKRGRHWKPEYGTRLKGYKPDGDQTLLLTDHDDWDCMHDLEAEGLLVRPSGISTTVGVTPKGHDFIAALNRYKTEGGNFAGFGDSELFMAVRSEWRVREG